MTLNGFERGTHIENDTATRPALSESIDVKVEVFVGDTVFTLAELHRLKANDILPLSATLADPVELRVNGVRFAHGELVSVGDKYAVRIVEIA